MVTSEEDGIKAETSPDQSMLDQLMVPDRIKALLIQIGMKVVKHGKMEDDGTVTIGSRLTQKQRVAKSLLSLVCAVNEVLENMNLVLADLDRLAENPAAFNDENPFRRYKTLVRFYFYEFGRFEDLHAFYLLFLQNVGQISKSERRSFRHKFFESVEPMIKIRNAMLHDSVEWTGHISPEIVMLLGAEFERKALINITTGERLTWRKAMKPLIESKRPLLYQGASQMRTLWNMLIANCTYSLIQTKKI